MIRIKYEDLLAKFQKILESRGFSKEHAFDAATVFATNSLDGVYSHGVNRFPRIVGYLDNKKMDPKNILTKQMSFGALERYDGHRGFGPLNAKLAMDRACDLAEEYGVGIVALGNNNHWLRGGTYGIQACNRGKIGICWSNTTANMPAWGAVDVKIGNNPFVMGIPRSNKEHVVIDCAMSQYSYGKVEDTRLKGKMLPYPGGYDTNGNLTCDPVEIEKAHRFLPAGYWKGSGLSIALDLIATVLTNANSVSEISTFDEEVGLSQVMIAIDPEKFNSIALNDEIVDKIIADIKSSIPVCKDGVIYYPGELELLTRKENLEHGIHVVESVLEKIDSFLK